MATNLDTKDMELAVDYGPAIAETFQFSKALTATANAIKSLTGASIGYNHEGTQTAFTFKQLLADGRSLTTVFKRLGDTEQFNILSQSISQAKTALQELNKVGVQSQTAIFSKSRKESIDAQKDAAERALKDRSSNGRTGTDAESRALNNAIGNVTRNIGKGGQDLASISDILRRMTAGATDFTVAEQKIVDQFRAVDAAAAKVGATAQRASEQQVNNANKELESLVKVGRQIQEKTFKQEKATQAAKDNLRAELAQAAATAKTTAAQSAKISSQREIARAGISNQVRGAIPTVGNFAEETKLDNAIARVSNNIGKTVPDAAALNNIFDRLIAGANNFTVAEQKIVAQFQAVSVAARNLGAAQAKIDQEALNNANKLLFSLIQQGEKIRLKAEAQARATAAADAEAKAQLAVAAAQARATADAKAARASQLSTATNVARGGIDSTLGASATFADDKGLQSYNTAVTKAIRLVAEGKVTVAEFARILGNVNGGTIERGLNPALDALQKRLLAVRDAATANAREIAESFRKAAIASAELTAKLAAVRAAATAKAAKSAADASTHSALSAGVNGEFANQLRFATPNQLNAYNAALNQAIKLVTEGKVKASEFIATLNNVQTRNLTVGLTGDQAKLQSSLQASSNAFRNLGKDGESAGNAIFLSWQNVVRIFEAQILYGIFNQLQSGFSDATQQAADYSRQIALIQTISQDAGISTGEWAEQIRRVSDNLGLGIVDTASAGYEALSNQVAKGADAFKFLNTAGTFAKTTGSNITDSVDLISSALNSFELDASQAERVAKSFFTTIDLGRVKTPELANSFGRSGVLAHQLGISLEELNASISTLTRQGIKPNEAYTLLNNVFQKLIKPTEALEGFFKKIGVASGEQAIQTYGYIGVLELLDKAFQGSASEAAKYFDEIRGGRGARNLTGSGLVQLKNDLQQNLNSGDNYENAKGIVEKSFGQQFEVETNKIKNFFVKDVGGTFLSNIISLTKAWGGLANIFVTIIGLMKQIATVGLVVYSVTKINTLITAINGVKAAYYATGYASQFAAFNSARAGATIAASAAVATAGVSVLVALVVAGALAWTEFGSSADRTIRELKDKLKAASDERIASEDKSADESYKAFAAGLKNSELAFLKFTATLRSQYSKVISLLREESESIGDSLKAQFDLIGSLIRSNLQEAETNLKKTVDNIQKLQQAIIDGPRKRNEDIYEENLKTNERNVKDRGPDERLKIDQERIAALAKIAKTQFDAGDIVGGIKTLDDIEKIINALSNLERNAKSTVNILSGVTKSFHNVIAAQVPIFKEINGQQTLTGFRALTIKEEQTKAKFTKKTLIDHDAPYRDTAYAAGNALLEFRLKLLDSQLAKEIQIRDAQAAAVNEKRKQFEIFQEAQKNLLKFNIYDRKGDLKEEYRGEAGQKKALEDQKKLQDATLAPLDIIGDPTSRIHQISELVKARVELEELFAKQNKNSNATIGAEGDLKKLDTTANEAVKTHADILAAKGKIKEADSEALRVQQEQTNNLRVQFEILRKGIIASSVGRSGTAGDTLGSIVQAQKILEKGKLTAADVAQIKKLYIEAAEGFDALNEKSKGVGKRVGARNSLGSTPTGEVGNDGEPNPTLNDSLASAGRSVVTLAPSLKARAELSAALVQLNEQLKVIEASAARLDPTFRAAGLGAGAFVNSLKSELSPLQELLQSTIAQVEVLKREVTNLKGLEARLPAGPPRPSTQGVVTSPEEHATGGRVGYYATGGFLGDFLTGKYARGSDTIPAMLTKGEYVVDAANTRKFLPILQSMSAGKFGGSDRGGNSTTNVGDINITVQGGSTSPQTIKEIGSGLRRAVRQGTIKLSR